MSLNQMNHTELFMHAQEINVNVRYSMSRQELIDILSGTEVDLPERSIDKIRLQIMRFILDRWDQVSACVSCPAATKSPRACFQCTDIQVVECALLNRNIIFKDREPT